MMMTAITMINNRTNNTITAIISYLYLSQKLTTELGGPYGGIPGGVLGAPDPGGEPGGPLGVGGGGVPTILAHPLLFSLIVTVELLKVPSALKVAIFKH